MRRPAVAWIVFGAWLAVAAATMGFAWSNRSFISDLSSLDSVDFVYVVATTLYTLVYALVGTVVVARTRHVLGWLLIAAAFTFLSSTLAEQYGVHGMVVSPGSVPGSELALWASYLVVVATFPALILILLLFPTGTTRSRRWRPLLVAAPASTALFVVSAAVRPGDTQGFLEEHGIVLLSPFGIEEAPSGLLGLAPGIIGALMVGIFVLSVLSLVLRFRGSQGVERQQIKLLALVAVIACSIILGIVVLSLTVVDSPEAENAVGSIGWGLLVTTLMLGLPLSIGASVLRYRLFDIDRIISRTLSYSLVTGLLLAAYVGLVILFQRVLPLGGSSDVAVAASTLIVAAAFVPLRRRTQDVVDKRFNRARYDAAHTVETFSSRLREEIDVDALGAELQGVVSRTMHPTHTFLWLRPSRLGR